MPVILARLKEHAIARPDDLDWAAAPLRKADAFGDIDGLTVRVLVPRGTRTRGEMHAAGIDA